MFSSNPSATPQCLEADGMRVVLPGGRTLLSDVYLRLETGFITGLLGRNGSGKSTLLRAVFGARAIPDASVRHNGRYVHPAYRRPGLINYLPQTPLLPAAMSLAEAARWLQVRPEESFAQFPELLTRLQSKAAELSGGQRRIAETLLLLHAPTLFTLLDEPLTHISPVQLEVLGAEITAAGRRKGVLISDHNHRVLLPLCQRLYLLTDGCLRSVSPDQPEVLETYGYLPPAH
jgi:ABC-type branched-subunit amino acid transport system ATPase component